MLDSEPEGGYRAGAVPAPDVADHSRNDNPRVDSSTGGAPSAGGEADETARSVAAHAEQPGEGGSGRETSRRRKAAQASNDQEVRPAGDAAEDEAAAKATRTRRRKVVASAAEPVAADADGPAPQPSTPIGTEVAPSAEDEARERRRRAALTPPTVLFMAPELDTVPVRRRAGEPAVAEPGEPGGEASEAARQRRRRRVRQEPVEEEAAVLEQEEEAGPPGEETAEAEEAPTPRRRRRRGRRGRGRGRGNVAESGEEVAEQAQPAEAQAEEPEELENVQAAEAAEGVEEAGGVEAAEGVERATSGVTRRRRRRRRRGTADMEIEVSEDGVETVVKIREPRRVVDEVQGVSGSTRLEAKRQRRRDGREQRRTRPPILSEAEFLARREAVDRVMVIRQRGDLTQIAVLEDGVLVEHYVSRADSNTMAGNVYLGKVQNVLPSMEAAFVDIGRGRNAVLYAGEVNWDATGLEGRARSIEQALKSGDSVLVQVTKDPIGHKGARLTSHIALSGRHLVYVPNGNASGISRKLPDSERKRLREILKKLVPEGAGVIVRTAAEGATEDELARDIKRLQAQWEDIQAKASQGNAPALLYQEPDLVIRVVRDLFNEDFRELVVQGDEAYDMVESYLTHVSPDLVPRLRRHTGVTDVFAEKRIDEQILKALDRKVYLPSGGHLVIDRTEAMTVIDVNTGKYTGTGGNLEETVTRNNLEAAEEIVRQLRLRDIGGIIVIDFIDMVLESNRELVLRRLTECLGRDRTKHQVTEITSLGLVQMTRKRIGAGLLEAFSETCECCKGRGVIIHTEPLLDRHRPSAASKVKAVASATARALGNERDRQRSKPAEPTAAEAEVSEDGEEGDLSGKEPTAAGSATAPSRLAGADDADAT